MKANAAGDTRTLQIACLRLNLARHDRKTLQRFFVELHVLDVAVAEVRLQGARVGALVGKLKAAGVPEHVRVRPCGSRPCRIQNDAAADRRGAGVGI
jgi:hypothetical protein